MLALHKKLTAAQTPHDKTFIERASARPTAR
jgi:hypothetical protein